MAVTLTAGTPFQATASVTTGTPTLPAGLVAGDWVALFCCLNASSGTINLPTGYTAALASIDSDVATGSTSHKMAIYFRKWVSGDANPAVTCTSGRLAVLPVKITGADPTTLFEGTTTTTATTTATTTVTAPSRVSTAATMVINVFSGRSATNSVFITWGTSAGMTELAEAGSQASGATNASLAVDYLTITAGATTGVGTSTASATTTGARGATLLVLETAAATPTRRRTIGKRR